MLQFQHCNRATPMSRKAIHARVEEPLIERLDNWRRQQSIIPPRAEAIRELIEQALGESGKATPKEAA
jgi:metal-responsive CopG/Arc/MetJ family transcriptional regulator